ncbi:Hypothetical predicted protein [Pelobates cultripes]|uniref:Uncharacterized protein n=1 Tax=Pelobates cultripes TaxID=61616 RepID=A0AAD1RAP3_PELCU|nr:Hypothetical predicted protein [Pelobates cultripes]
MPFIFPQTGRKTQRKSGAYHELRGIRTMLQIPEPTETPTYSPWFQYTQPQQNPDTMGRRSQKPGACKDTQDISAMLQRPAAAKLAAEPECTDGSDCSEGPPGEQLEPSCTQALQTEPARGKDLTPATRQDIAELLLEMRQLHAADLELLKTDLTAVTARTQASEEAILDLRQEAQGFKESIIQLQSSQANLTNRADIAEDRHRQVNIKIPDSVGITELPHYLRRLTTSLLPHTKAKKLTFEGFFHIPKPRQAPLTASHNFIIRCHSSTEKALIMAAVRGKTPLTFESS